jgi:hypothetical protein
MVSDLFDALPLRAQTEALRLAWVRNRWPERRLSAVHWVGYVPPRGRESSVGSCRSPSRVPPVEQLPSGPFTVWRGARIDRARGMAWTLHEPCARNFARPAIGDVDFGLFRCELGNDAVLAWFGESR